MIRNVPREWAGSSEIQQNIKETFIEKYGTSNLMEIEQIKEKIKETNKRKYGSEWYLGTEQCINANPNIISNINIKFAELLSDNNIDFEFEFSLGSYSYDFAIEGTGESNGSNHPIDEEEKKGIDKYDTIIKNSRVDLLGIFAMFFTVFSIAIFFAKNIIVSDNAVKE